MEKLRELDEKLADARKLRATLNALLSETTEHQAWLENDYRAAVERGDDDATLDSMDAEILKTGRQCLRLQIRVGQTTTEESRLDSEHAEALRAVHCNSSRRKRAPLSQRA